MCQQPYTSWARDHVLLRQQAMQECTHRARAKSQDIWKACLASFFYVRPTLTTVTEPGTGQTRYTSCPAPHSPVSAAVAHLHMSRRTAPQKYTFRSMTHCSPCGSTMPWEKRMLSMYSSCRCWKLSAPPQPGILALWHEASSYPLGCMPAEPQQHTRGHVVLPKQEE